MLAFHLGSASDREVTKVKYRLLRFVFGQGHFKVSNVAVAFILALAIIQKFKSLSILTLIPKV